MKKLIAIVAIIIAIIAAYESGYRHAINNATTAIGFIDEETNQFLLDVDGNYYAWDI